MVIAWQEPRSARIFYWTAVFLCHFGKHIPGIYFQGCLFFFAGNYWVYACFFACGEVVRSVSSLPVASAASRTHPPFGHACVRGFFGRATSYLAFTYAACFAQPLGLMPSRCSRS